MGKTIGVFIHHIRAPKKDDTPFIPFGAEIQIELPLSQTLASEQEIDGYVQELKKDLDRVGRDAKRALQRANQRTYELTRAEIAARKDESK